MYAYSGMECDRHNFLSFQAIFSSFAPLLTPKIKIWKKCKKKKKNTCRYYPFTHVYHWSRSYDVWFLRYEVQQTGIFVFLGNFLSFYQPPPLPNSLKKENIKNEKKPGDIIILHKCSKNHNHLLYCSRDMVHDRCLQLQLLFFILGYLLPFYPPNSSKNENFQKMKKTPGDIIILHKCTINYD